MRKVSETQRLGTLREEQAGAEEVRSESREISMCEEE